MKTPLLILACLTLNVSGQTINEFSSFIEKWEGRKLTTYRCSEGFLTVGIGHRLVKGEKIAPKITNKTADLFLARDSVKALAIAKRQVSGFDYLPSNAKLVVVSLTFNVGENGLSKFRKMIAALNAGDMETAALELRSSLWYEQVGQERKDNHVNLLKFSKI